MATGVIRDFAGQVTQKMQMLYSYGCTITPIEWARLLEKIGKVAGNKLSVVISPAVTDSVKSAWPVMAALSGPSQIIDALVRCKKIVLGETKQNTKTDKFFALAKQVPGLAMASGYAGATYALVTERSEAGARLLRVGKVGELAHETLEAFSEMRNAFSSVKSGKGLNVCKAVVLSASAVAHGVSLKMGETGGRVASVANIVSLVASGCKIVFKAVERTEASDKGNKNTLSRSLSADSVSSSESQKRS